MIHIFVNVNEEGYFIATLCAEMKEIATCGGDTLSSAVTNAIRHAEITAWEGLVEKDEDDKEDDDKENGGKKGGLN
jgi:hypothetical protein